jgi:hypothetical protein
MPSRASAVKLNWGNVALTSGPATERQEAPAGGGQGSPRREGQAADPTRTSRHLDEGSCDVETVSATVEAYNEAAFRYFLQVEEKRFLRSNRKFLLLLVDLNGDSGAVEDFDPALGKKLFAALWPCVRETDFVGWYRQGRVIGVACTQLNDAQGATVSSVVADRFQKALRDALPEPIGSRVHVRSHFLPSNGADRS